jgi:hypothetical protein
MIKEKEALTSDSKTLTLDESYKLKYQNFNDVKVLIVWLEQMQDADNMPIGKINAEAYS